jgi:hypothetical protein
LLTRSQLLFSAHKMSRESVRRLVSSRIDLRQLSSGE